jgi:osmotically-inducible protein OsmY
MPAARSPIIEIILSCALAGCADYRQCGFEGCSGDTGITSQVQTRMALYPALQPPNLITVQTLRRVVYLYGVVDTSLERELAGSVALDTPGVSKVVNSIGISGNR